VRRTSADWDVEGDPADGTDGATVPDGASRVDPVPADASFALCLTHDVDRPYKTYQSLFYGLTGPSRYHLRTLVSGENPYWQFDAVRTLEAELGVRSAFYFLDEQRLFRDRPVRDWLDPANWRRYLGRYSLSDPAITRVVRDLDAGGWEVGLHGSYESYRDVGRLGAEKAHVERLVGHGVIGGRQHYLNLDVPETWRIHRRLGLHYDASLGSSETVGFEFGYLPFRPFDDEFVVFPLSIMDNALPDSFEPAWRVCEETLAEAAEHGAVMTVLWHPRVFAEREFPGYRRLYRRLVERAQALGAWVGPPAALYERIAGPAAGDRPGGATDATRTDGSDD